MNDPRDLRRAEARAAQQLSDAQRAFVDAATSLGATAPATACALSALPRLSGVELDVLIDSGLIREAADRQYYVYRSRRVSGFALAAAGGAIVTPDEPQPTHAPRFRWRRVVITLCFWMVVLVIPVLFLSYRNGR